MQQEQYIHIDKYGDKSYYKDKSMNIYHRLDGAAVELSDGSKSWYVDGKFHRLDGPAVEWSGGYKAWFVDGKRHRLDGAAVESASGSKEWFVDGKRHRLDGPAIEYAGGGKAWYVDDKFLSEKEFDALSAPTLELTLEQIAAKFNVDVSKLKVKK